MQPLTEQYHFCPKCGVESSVQDQVLRCKSCGFTRYFNPAVAVASIIQDASTGKVLLIKRARDPGKGKFGLPGGFCDPGETGEQAADRETSEEIGLEIPPENLRYVCSSPNDYEHRDTVFRVLDLIYCTRVNSLNGLVREEAEVSSIHLFHPAKLPLDEIAFNSLRVGLINWKAQAEC